MKDRFDLFNMFFHLKEDDLIVNNDESTIICFNNLQINTN